MAPTNLFAGSTRPNQRPFNERMDDLTKNTQGKIHQANTPIGWVAYEADKMEWKRRFPSKWAPDETCPYPLTPGTQPVGKGECYKCGHLHFKLTDTCANTVVDEFETIYRGVAGKIMRESKRLLGPYRAPPIPSTTTSTTPKANVAAVHQLGIGQSLQFIPASDEYQAHYIIVSESGDQGNGEGPTE